MRQGLLARMRGGDGRLIAVLMAYAVLVAGIVGIGSSPAFATHHAVATCLTPGDDGPPAAPASHPSDHCDWCFAGTAPSLDVPAPALAGPIAAGSPSAPVILVEQAPLRLGWAAQPSRGPPSRA